MRPKLLVQFGVPVSTRKLSSRSSLLLVAITIMLSKTYLTDDFGAYLLVASAENEALAPNRRHNNLWAFPSIAWRICFSFTSLAIIFLS